MPELPEVEAARKLIATHFRDKTICEVTVANDPKVIVGADSEELQKALQGLKFKAAQRKGKHLWLEFGVTKQCLMLHFGMTGSIVVKTPSGQIIAAKYERLDPDLSGNWPPKYCKLDIKLNDGTLLAFTDPRRFARVRWMADPLSVKPLCDLANDALTQPHSLTELSAALKGFSRRPALRIKALLLDQESVLSGVGNWVADEVLFQARIHPEQQVIKMTEKQIAAVHTALHNVLRLAVSVDADSQLFPKDWLFHYRWTGKKASSINGMPISFVTVGSRTSAFVPSLQRLIGEVESRGSQAGKGPKSSGRGEDSDVGGQISRSKGAKRGREATVKELKETETIPPLAENLRGPKLVNRGRK